MVKRVFDILISLILFLIFSPLLIGLVLISGITFRKNPIYSQVRIGKDEKLFNLFKIRSMNETGSIPAFFKMIRNLGLDEFPQIFNVIRSDMSLIGPRPLLPEYLSLMTVHERKRHLVKPGITGLAQINGRNILSWESKFKYDLIYIKYGSFKLDLTILIKTIPSLFKNDAMAVRMDEIRPIKLR